MKKTPWIDIPDMPAVLPVELDRSAKAIGAEQQEAFDFVMSWPSKERREIAEWLAGALTGHGSPLSAPAAELLADFRVRFPEMA